MTRQEANIKICKILKDYCEQNPDVRFTQALFNLGINEFKTMLDLDSTIDRTCLKDKYDEESEVTLKNLYQNV